MSEQTGRLRSRQDRMALWFIKQTTPSGFACHPSTGGEFMVPSFDIIASRRNPK
jgi:hypothetical protein